MQYRMVWQTPASGLPWQYDYDQVSDNMAVNYAKRIMANDYGIRTGCMALLVWRLEPEELIAELVLDAPQVRNRI